jgi:4-hydroxybenzoate polyprenyltransferase
VLVALGLVGCVLLGISFGPTSLLLLLLATAGGLAYDVWLKPTPFSIVGYLVGFLTLVTWIWFIAGRLVPLFAAVYPLGAIAVLTAHLAQALPDIDSDGARGQRGPAVIMGAAVTRRVVRLGLACMIAGALMLAVVSRDVPAIALTLAGFAAAAAALLSRDSGPESRRDEFRRVAAAVAMLAIGALTSLQSLIR